MNSQYQAVVDIVSNLATAADSKDQQIAALKNVAVFDALETTPWQVAKGALANSGQAGSLAVTSQAQTGVESAWLGLTPQGPWANAYFYKKNAPDPNKRTYRYEMSFMFADLAASNASNCIELDIQQVVTGMVFNPGLQWNFNENMLRVWDRSSAAPGATGKGNWTPTGKPCPRWNPMQWQRFIFEAHRDDSKVYMDAVTAGGVRVPIGMSFNSPRLGLADGMNCAIQLDGNKAGTAYKVYIDGVRFSAS